MYNPLVDTIIYEYNLWSSVYRATVIKKSYELRAFVFHFVITTTLYFVAQITVIQQKNEVLFFIIPTYNLHSNLRPNSMYCK